jgi:hypothetical protein
MAEEQSYFSDMTYYLLSALAGQTGGNRYINDLHVGVTTTDAGTGGYNFLRDCAHPEMGALQGRPVVNGCTEEFDPPYFAYSTSNTSENQPAYRDIRTLFDDLQCVTRYLEFGCDYEQPFQSVRLAMTERVEDGTNAGFFRRGAMLVVVFVQDDDDCTAINPELYDPNREDPAKYRVPCSLYMDERAPVEEFVNELRSQRPSGRVIVGGWIPVPIAWDGSLEELELVVDPETDRYGHHANILCGTGLGMASKAPRLAEMILLMGSNGVAWSICLGLNEDQMEAFGQLVLDHLDPVACLPSNPPANTRCEVTLNLLDASDECPQGTREIEPGMCELREEQWRLLETDRCTELRASDEVAVPPGAWLALRCFAR